MANDQSNLSKMAFTALSSTPESFHQILDAIGDMILVKGAKSRILWANKAFCSYYGMSNEQLKGLIDAEFNEPDYTQQYVKDDAYVFENGKILDIPLEPVTRYDGVVRYFHTVKTPIFDKEGKVIMTVGVSRDITEKMNAQKAIEEERAKSMYSAKMATLGEMAGGIAHEINTPLGAIILNAETIAAYAEKLSPAETKILKHASQIVSIGQRVGKIILSLKGFSREAKDDAPEIFTVRTVLEHTLDLCSEKFKSRGIQLTIDPKNLDSQLAGKPIQICQTLLNLISNAMDSVQDLEEKWVRIDTHFHDKKIEIRVTDSGSGIPQDIAEKIFQPFFTTKEIGKGTGLGLSISKGIIQEHNGDLFIDKNSKNTCFVIQLPQFQEKMGAA